MADDRPDDATGSRRHPRPRSPGAVAILGCLLLGSRGAGPEAALAEQAVEMPTVSDDRLQVSLVAREPEVVTPVGLAVDRRGRLYVVESHTHFRPDDYKGPAKDVIKRFEDRDRDGRFETVSVFAEGFTYAMNLAFTSDGGLLVVERGRVVRLDDTDNDGRADKQKDVLRLETTGSYPHNGLGGIVLGPDRHLYVGMGENFGHAYTLRGSDGQGVAGGGEGGNVFRCRADGSRCARFATGFWNPFALTFFAGKHLLAVDDDPEVRPPDRLLDVIEGADFGFKYKYGREAEHPFVAWKGELPGTLPLADSVGEGVTGIATSAAAALPKEYGDTVLVASWSDRRIEVHRLRPQGASLKGEMSVLVQGGRAFRPVALAVAPDGSVFFTDWVQRRYAIHGHGRIWRLAPKRPLARRPAAPRVSPERRRLDRVLATTPAAAARTLPAALTSPDPFLRAAAVTALARPALRSTATTFATHADPAVRLGAVLAVRQAAAPEAKQHIARWLGDSDEAVRLIALIFAAEDKLVEGDGRGALHAAVTTRPPSPRLLEAYRTGVAMLGVTPAPGFEAPSPEALLRRLASATTTKAADQRDAIWRLASETPVRQDALARFEKVALDRSFDASVRADAVGALAMHARVRALGPLLDDPEPRLRVEAARALRADMGTPQIRQALGAALDRAIKAKADDETAATFLEELRFALQDERVPAPPRPETPADWRAAVDRGGDPDAGRRAFVHPGNACSRCHRVGGLGQSVGPPLTFIGNERPERLLESLLDPSVDVVWGARLVTTKDGSEYVGMIRKRHPDGALTLTNAAGQQVTLPAADIAHQREADGSLMPDGLQEAMTVQQFRDLFAFLRAQNR